MLFQCLCTTVVAMGLCTTVVRNYGLVSHSSSYVIPVLVYHGSDWQAEVSQPSRLNGKIIRFIKFVCRSLTLPPFGPVWAPTLCANVRPAPLVPEILTAAVLRAHGTQRYGQTYGRLLYFRRLRRSSNRCSNCDLLPLTHNVSTFD